jgi:cytochrome c oxidase subunit 3
MGSTTLTPPKTKPPGGTRLGKPGRSGDGFGWGDGHGFSGEPGGGWSVPARAYRTGMWLALGAIVMLFAAFTSALVVRRGISNDWVPTALPRILYLNTAILLASSLTLELGRRALTADLATQFARWLYATAGLGIAFVAGQLTAWHQLAARGVYLATNPSSSFFYLLTAAHGVHLLGGIAALAYLCWRVAGFNSSRRTAVDVTAIYWHFLTGLWVYILVLLTARF